MAKDKHPLNPLIMINNEIDEETNTYRDKNFSYWHDKTKSPLSKGAKLYGDCWKQGFFALVGEFSGHDKLAITQTEKSEGLILLSMLGLGLVHFLVDPTLSKADNTSGLHAGLFTFINPAAWLAAYPTLLTVLCLTVTSNFDTPSLKSLGALASTLLLAIALPLWVASAAINLVEIALAAVIQTVITPFWMLGKAIELKHNNSNPEATEEADTKESFVSL